MVEQLQLTIDGLEVSVSPEITVLEACRLYDIPIPTLCHDQELTSAGACRLCVVEIEGMRTLAPACVTKVAPGMTVRTKTRRVEEARRTILELLAANHPLDCMTCQKMGDCALAQYAYEYGVTGELYKGRRRDLPLDDGNPFILRDPNKCINCGKCIRACTEIQGQNVLDFSFRGFDVRVGPAYNVPYGESDCVFCGTCLAVCPVGALTEKGMQGKGRPWEIRKVRTICPYCGVGCSLDLNVKDGKVVGVTSPETSRSLCVKGRFGCGFIHHSDRLKTPLLRKNGQLAESSWLEAITYTAERLKAIRKLYGPEALGVLSSARCTNEENYVMNRFARGVLGTNHIDHCARL